MLGFLFCFFPLSLHRMPITNKYFLSAGKLSVGTIIIHCCKISIAKSSLSLLHCSSKVQCQGKKRTGKLMQPSIHQQVGKECRDEKRHQRTVLFVKTPTLKYHQVLLRSTLLCLAKLADLDLGRPGVTCSLPTVNWKRFTLIWVQALVINSVH